MIFGSTASCVAQFSASQNVRSSLLAGASSHSGPGGAERVWVSVQFRFRIVLVSVSRLSSHDAGNVDSQIEVFLSIKFILFNPFVKIAVAAKVRDRVPVDI